jgi:hypothetical protein
LRPEKGKIGLTWHTVLQHGVSTLVCQTEFENGKSSPIASFSKGAKRESCCKIFYKDETWLFVFISYLFTRVRALVVTDHEFRTVYVDNPGSPRSRINPV